MNYYSVSYRPFTRNNITIRKKKCLKYVDPGLGGNAQNRPFVALQIAAVVTQKNLSKDKTTTVSHLEDYQTHQKTSPKEQEGNDEPKEPPDLGKFLFEQQKKRHEWLLMHTPCDGQHPHILAKADASDEFTLRAMVSSGGVRERELINSHKSSLIA